MTQVSAALADGGYAAGDGPWLDPDVVSDLLDEIGKLRALLSSETADHASAALLGILARRGVMPQEVAFEILGAVLNDGKPRLSRLREWVDSDA